MGTFNEVKFSENEILCFMVSVLLPDHYEHWEQRRVMTETCAQSRAIGGERKPREPATNDNDSTWRRLTFTFA